MMIAVEMCVRDGSWLVAAAAAASAVSAGGDVTASNQRCQRRRMPTVFHYRPLLSARLDRPCLKPATTAKARHCTASRRRHRRHQWRH